MLNFNAMENEFHVTRYRGEYYVNYGEVELLFGDDCDRLVFTQDGFNHDIYDSIEKTFTMEGFLNIFGEPAGNCSVDEYKNWINELKTGALQKCQDFANEVNNVCKYLNYDL